MLGADHGWLAEAQRECFESTCFTGTPLALVGDEDGGFTGLAHKIGECAVGWRRAGACVDEKKYGVRLRDSRRRLRLHSRRKAFAGGVFETRRIDDPKR